MILKVIYYAKHQTKFDYKNVLVLKKNMVFILMYIIYEVIYLNFPTREMPHTAFKAARNIVGYS